MLSWDDRTRLVEPPLAVARPDLRRVGELPVGVASVARRLAVPVNIPWRAGRRPLVQGQQPTRPGVSQPRRLDELIDELLALAPLEPAEVAQLRELWQQLADLCQPPARPPAHVAPGHRGLVVLPHHPLHAGTQLVGFRCEVLEGIAETALHELRGQLVVVGSGLDEGDAVRLALPPLVLMEECDGADQIQEPLVITAGAGVVGGERQPLGERDDHRGGLEQALGRLVAGDDRLMARSHHRRARRRWASRMACVRALDASVRTCSTRFAVSSLMSSSVVVSR